jgi:hypothetical protein
VTTKTDLIELARKVLNAPAPSLQDLEAAAAALADVRADLDVEIAGMAARRREILGSDGSAHEIDKQLEKHDETVRALVRRSEVEAAISTKVAARLMAAREAEAAAARAAAYDEAEKLVTELASRFEAFLSRAAPEASALLSDYAAVQMKVSAVNRNLPPNAAPVRSLEQRRTGEPQTRGTVVRRVKFFCRGNDRIIECGRAEAAETSAGLWNIFIPSRSSSGGEPVGGCHIREFVEVKLETLQSRPEALLTALRIPNFYEPYVSTGASRRTMPAAEWDATNGEAEPVPMPVAAE